MQSGPAGHKPRPADPFPAPLLSAEIGAFTEPGSCTETSDPPLEDELLLPVLEEPVPAEPVPVLAGLAAEPLPVSWLATETGRLTESRPDTDTTDTPCEEPDDAEEPDADPLPVLLLATETGALTKAGRFTDASDPVLAVLEPLPEPADPDADPLPELLLAPRPAR